MYLKNQRVYEVLAVVSLLAAVAVAMFVLSARAPEARASGQQITCVDGNLNCAPNATSTQQTFIGAGLSGATTTFPTANGIYTPNATSIDMNIQVVASTSASAVLLWQYQFSNDDINWYSQTNSSASGAVTTYSGPVTNSYAPGTTATTTINVRLTSIASKYFRVKMSGAVASSSVYEQFILNNSIPQ